MRALSLTLSLYLCVCYSFVLSLHSFLMTWSADEVSLPVSFSFFPSLPLSLWCTVSKAMIVCFYFIFFFSSHVLIVPLSSFVLSVHEHCVGVWCCSVSYLRSDSGSGAHKRASSFHFITSVSVCVTLYPQLNKIIHHFSSESTLIMLPTMLVSATESKIKKVLATFYFTILTFFLTIAWNS